MLHILPILTKIVLFEICQYLNLSNKIISFKKKIYSLLNNKTTDENNLDLRTNVKEFKKYINFYPAYI